MGKKIGLAAYLIDDPVQGALFFLGKKLAVKDSKGNIAGIIVETEAYGGAEDKACHGYGKRLTPRNKIIFQQGGITYVYFCYGMHHLLNFVLGPEGVPMAVLIRGVIITEGKELVKQRRKGNPEHHWADGPGKVTKAMGITLADNGISLIGDRIWVEESGLEVPDSEIERTPRIGVDYAEEWAKKPLRFVWKQAMQRIMPSLINASSSSLNKDRVKTACSPTTH
ncbi:3-methyladenine DNA glycosylase [Methylacidiphilum kamchatkense Kam1]|uniref:Putative 3-methyladenine DNA glycosylase n=1 Tax=Methylacidiphilum kamchatkense Kam1 TaxID=1202785 RepID=A0A0C1RSS6_9BACT|nr:DNA-3-methyladenine glycosylase [Methylacidiphilum kamchatkense]KIE58006.1 3-methyladenine DNA glycosylase [Methylacidiphilum kamchatkense Kam1]QDQ42446.1 DNA-3-methyladenine glycosylase [Methylacidiphilum kamchatkense Kam1]